LNRFVGLGNLTKDPEVKETKTGKKVCVFTIAINNNPSANVLYLDVEAWNKTADNCARFLSKGRKVMVDGRLHLNSWKNKEGQTRNKIYCIADLVTFLSGNNEKSNDNPSVNQTQETEQEDEFADVPF
jgi:single-strand DNA-binding protein|tara:strand:+ start:351 stop:734 length:384 start_codon:yes stop_codon:yes gene_type:complete